MDDHLLSRVKTMDELFCLGSGLFLMHNAAPRRRQPEHTVWYVRTVDNDGNKVRRKKNPTDLPDIPEKSRSIIYSALIHVNLRTIRAYLRQERHTRPGVSLPASGQLATAFQPSPSRIQTPASSPHHPAATLPSGRRLPAQNLLL